jgi:hypothetical protein
MVERKTTILVALTAATGLAACEKATAPQWLRITQAEPCAVAGCDQPAFYLDTANISVTGGTPYVILQTRYGDGRFGAIRAEANCPRAKLEPTALKEAVFAANGTPLVNRMITMSAADESAVLEHACSRR